MSHILRVLCRPSVTEGFALAGVPALPAAGPGDAAAWIVRLSREPEVGVVLVEEDLFEALPEELHRSLERQPLPIVVPFPGPTWVKRPPPEAYVVELLRRAIGYRVRLR